MIMNLGLRRSGSPIGLNDRQKHVFLECADGLPSAKRLIFLRRVTTALRLAGRYHPTDLDLKDAVDRSLQGLVQNPLK